MTEYVEEEVPRAAGDKKMERLISSFTKMLHECPACYVEDIKEAIKVFEAIKADY